MRALLSTTLLLTLAAAGSVRAADWPHWRGPLGTGVSPETNLPASWSATSQLAWRIALPGVGVSSPAVWGDLVFVTSQLGAGIRRSGSHPSLVQGAGAAESGERTLTGGGAARDRTTFMISAHKWSDGSTAWSREVVAEGALPAVHDKHNLATPSPATNGDVIVAWFGTGQVVALDMKGAVRWSKHLGASSPFDIDWGHSSSPVLHDGLVLLLCYHPSASYLVALDAATGAEKWRADRGRGVLSYSTPIVISTGAGDAVLVNSSTGIEAFNPRTGASLWQVKEDSRFPIPVPVLVEGVIYATRGYRSGPTLAILPDGRGDVTTSHVQWRVPTGAPYVSSLVTYGGLVYTGSELGIVTCLDAASGERLWQERVGGVFTASPVAGDGKIYFVSETGETTVIKAGRSFELVARNRLDAHFVASPAIARGRIFLRADNALFAVGR